MELLIVKNGHVYARTQIEDDDAALYTLEAVPDADMPDYPTTPAVVGKYYDLDYQDGALAWVCKARPLTTAEKLQQIESRLDEMEYPAFVQPTGAHDAYSMGDKMTYNGKHYVSIYDGANVLTPDAYPAGWEEV